MMIAPEYVLMMARYNAWQNKEMKAALQSLDEAALRQDRGAFFGSIFATANHLLWGDGLWMSRFDGGQEQVTRAEDHTKVTPNLSEWAIARLRMDGRILKWAENLHAVDLVGDHTWYSGSIGAEVSLPLSHCVAHFFNHQTHHRGQIHAMATAAGAKGWTSDLVFMPEDDTWP